MPLIKHNINVYCRIRQCWLQCRFVINLAVLREASKHLWPKNVSKFGTTRHHFWIGMRPSSIVFNCKLNVTVLSLLWRTFCFCPKANDIYVYQRPQSICQSETGQSISNTTNDVSFVRDQYRIWWNTFAQISETNEEEIYFWFSW